MTSTRFHLCVLSAALLLSSGAAYADGMPFRDAPAQNSSALDKAIDEIQNMQPADSDIPPPEKPVAVTTPPPAPPPAPAPKPAAAAPPVPEARVVEVQPNSSFFGLSVGMYDAFTHNQKAASFNLQIEPGVKIAGILQPLFGALATTNGALMGYGGVGLPIMLSKHVRLMPSVAVGAYHAGGGVDLGQVLAWRGGAELAYIFDDKSRIGLNAHVLTNGSLHSSDRTEVIGLAYTMPFELFSGKQRKPAEDKKK